MKKDDLTFFEKATVWVGAIAIFALFASIPSLIVMWVWAICIIGRCIKGESK